MAVVTRTTLMRCQPEDARVTAQWRGVMTPALPCRPALLFCPADRPDRYEKALAAADAVILDLEDGVGADAKDAARAALVATDLDPARVIVRVNATGTPSTRRTWRRCAQTGYRQVMLPKTETRAQLDALGGEWRVVALCETPLGIVNAAEVAAAPSVIAVMWGAEDLIAAMRGRTSRLSDGAVPGRRPARPVGGAARGRRPREGRH